MEARSCNLSASEAETGRPPCPRLFSRKQPGGGKGHFILPFTVRKESQDGNSRQDPGGKS